MRSDFGIPSDVIRFSTPHSTRALICWFSNVLAASVPPSNALNRETEFSARLCRVAPLLFRHSYRTQ